MRTQLRSVHEEQYSTGSRTLGVIINYDNEGTFKESFVYIFNHERKMYTFFDTMVDMFDYIFYGEEAMKRAYMTEADFDLYYDADYLDNTFNQILKWTS